MSDIDHLVWETISFQDNNSGSPIRMGKCVYPLGITTLVTTYPQCTIQVPMTFSKTYQVCMYNQGNM